MIAGSDVHASCLHLSRLPGFSHYMAVGRTGDNYKSESCQLPRASMNLDAWAQALRLPGGPQQGLHALHLRLE